MLRNGWHNGDRIIHLSDEIMMGIAVKQKIDERMNEITETAYSIFTASLLFMFLVFYQHDKRFGLPYLEIDKIIKATYNSEPPNNPVASETPTQA